MEKGKTSDISLKKSKTDNDKTYVKPDTKKHKPLDIVGSGGGGGTYYYYSLYYYCWVAREVYGTDSPQWLLFRDWMLNNAPSWFRTLYINHGESFASFISNKTYLKRIIRHWMDSKTRNRIWVNDGVWCVSEAS